MSLITAVVVVVVLVVSGLIAFALWKKNNRIANYNQDKPNGAELETPAESAPQAQEQKKALQSLPQKPASEEPKEVPLIRHAKTF